MTKKDNTETTRGTDSAGVVNYLRRLMRGEHLGQDESAVLLDHLVDENVTDAQIGALLTALALKGETSNELAGLAAAMRERSRRIVSKHSRFIDTAGTGSSIAKTFNVSTAAALVIAGAGLPVAKHGARAATSRSGSADVLTALGVKVDTDTALSERCLNEHGICFMFAPLYHQATARVARVRRELGVHTIFNLLGPLTNPAGAPFQLTGVWNAKLVRPVAEAASALGVLRAWVVHGSDGLDEITVSGETFVAEVSPEGVRDFRIAPEDFGLRRSPMDELRAGDSHANARVIVDVLRGERRDSARTLIVMNAAAALYISGFAGDLKSAAELAAQSIDGGAALKKLQLLVEVTNSKL